jgi:hypothetical protein
VAEQLPNSSGDPRVTAQDANVPEGVERDVSEFAASMALLYTVC